MRGRQQQFGKPERAHVRLAKGNQCYKKHSKNLCGCKRYCWDNCAVESIICFSVLQQFLFFCMLCLGFKENFLFFNVFGNIHRWIEVGILPIVPEICLFNICLKARRKAGCQFLESHNTAGSKGYCKKEHFHKKYPNHGKFPNKFSQ